MSDDKALLDRIRRTPEDDTVRLVFADWLEEHDEPERAEFIRADVYLGLANRDVKAGIDEVKSRLRLQRDNRPRLKIHRSCVHLIREFPDYVWDSNRKDDAPVKRNDHALDALRYMLMGIRDYFAEGFAAGL